MVYCCLCSEYIGFFTLKSFCERCDKLRRLYLINNKDVFVSKVCNVFLKDEVNVKQDVKTEVKEPDVKNEVVDKKKSYAETTKCN